MKILDEVYGANNWQRTHEVIGGNLYCTVSIWDDGKKQWIGILCQLFAPYTSSRIFMSHRASLYRRSETPFSLIVSKSIVDAKRLKAEQPDIYTSYLTQSSYRRLSVA